ncbi:MAG: 30S ribosomal protein S1 [Thermodesulfovibrionales bacterium]|nr:30S ribosomal protein S1 [Thermodesulfovibrionales bacterium]
METGKNELEKLYAETFQGIEPGSILRGKVVAIKEDSVIVDVGYKSEGIIPASEFHPSELSGLSVGDDVDVYVEDIKDVDGVVVLSKDRASKMKAWSAIESCMKNDAPIEGRIVGATKGGMFVDVIGVRAFLPGSHVDIRVVRDTDALIGEKMLFKVLKLNDKRSNIIVSRKVYLEEERLGKRAKTLEMLKDGAVMKGIVKNITDYGVFVDLGGIDGLLHISDISWGRITHPSEFFAIRDEIDVIVLKYDEESRKVTLGYKQLKPDPWTDVDERYPQDSKVKGEVVSLTDYGAFVEIEDGLEGLVHISELDWAPRPKHPSKYLTVGETVEAVVLKVDKNERRLSLSIRQLKPSPWQLIAETYKVGQTISGKVRGITEFGAFVGFPEGVDGLIHISDISWTKHIKHPLEVLKKGQKVDAVILNIEPEKERIALGLKHLTPDPWLGGIPARYRLGDELSCRVLRLTDFGIFVELDSEVEGLIYSSEIIEAEEPLNEGDEVRARIIKVDCENRKIGLSMKNVKRGGE